MRKWEQKYEEFSNSKELEEKMAILEDKINGKVAFKEEYEEFKKLSAIKENLPKVKNILQLREKLENENKEINEEIKKREARVQLNKKIEKLEEKLKEHEAEWDKITKELKGELSEEEKTSKKTRLKQIETLKQKNNVEFGNCQDQLKLDAEEIAKSKFKDISTDELKEQAYQGKMKVSKCNLACNKLMQGYSWDSVEVALDKFKDERFTAKGKEAEKMRQNRAAAKSENEKEQNKEVVKNENENENEQVQKSEAKSQSKEQKSISNEGNKSLAVPEEKTIFQKIKDKLKNLTNRAKDWIMGKEEEEIEENVAEVIEETEKETESKETLISKLINKTKEWMNKRNKSEKDEEVVENKKEEKKEAEVVENKKEDSKEDEQPKKDDFKEYLKFVAENGVNITPEEKAKEDEINKTIEMLVESRRQKAQKEGKTFDEESTRKTARAVAENSYNRKHQPTQQATQENNGQDR